MNTSSGTPNLPGPRLAPRQRTGGAARKRLSRAVLMGGLMLGLSSCATRPASRSTSLPPYEAEAVGEYARALAPAPETLTDDPGRLPFPSSGAVRLSCTYR